MVGRRLGRAGKVLRELAKAEASLPQSRWSGGGAAAVARQSLVDTQSQPDEVWAC
jgi:hypothetical protein